MRYINPRTFTNLYSWPYTTHEAGSWPYPTCVRQPRRGHDREGFVRGFWSVAGTLSAQRFSRHVWPPNVTQYFPSPAVSRADQQQHLLQRLSVHQLARDFPTKPLTLVLAVTCVSYTTDVMDSYVIPVAGTFRPQAPYYAAFYITVRKETNKNLAIANRSRVSCAHNTSITSIGLITPWPWNLG